MIASGSLSYTVSSSDTDAESTTDSGTETLADEVSSGPSQTASYSITESTPDNETAYETGTETLGAGGTISSGSASFSWGDRNRDAISITTKTRIAIRDLLRCRFGLTELHRHRH